MTLFGISGWLVKANQQGSNQHLQEMAAHYLHRGPVIAVTQLLCRKKSLMTILKDKSDEIIRISHTSY